MADAIVEAVDLSKEYLTGSYKVAALDHVSVTIRKGDFVALMGPSGSGKSTLLHCMAGMDRPSSGNVKVQGQEISGLSDSALAKWRNENIGFVFQSFNLIPVLTAIENVELPLKLTNLSSRERREHAETALKLVGLGDRLHHLPRQLSGGQEQRVAIARAIVTDPALILADEPTGNLDATSCREVLGLLTRLVAEFGKTVVMVTHDLHAARAAHTVRYLEKGVMLAEGTTPDGWAFGQITKTAAHS